jgi:CheY-like chemotaxis protein
MQTNCPKISIVVTDIVDRLKLETLFKGEKGFQWVSSYANDCRAVDCLPLDQPELILLDVFLPGLNGFECARKLKYKMPNAKITLLSELYDVVSLQWAQQAQAHGLLKKPLDEKYLMLSIHYALNGGSPISQTELRQWPDLGQLRAVRPIAFSWLVRAALSWSMNSEPDRLVLAAIARATGYRVKELLQMVDLKPDQLRRLLLKLIHTTPHQFLRENQIQEKARLKRCGIPISDMADQLGFAHRQDVYLLP